MDFYAFLDENEYDDESKDSNIQATNQSKSVKSVKPIKPKSTKKIFGWF